MPSILNATTTSGLVTSADNSGSLQLQTNNGTTAVTIDTSQNVGIGTTSPVGLLHVAYNTNSTGWQYLANTNTGSSTRASYNIFTNSGGGDLRIEVNNSANTADVGASGVKMWNHANAALTLGTNATERMRITSGGDVYCGQSSYTFGVNPTTGTDIVAGGLIINATRRTTGASGNTLWDSAGVFYRSTSSLKYKRDVETMQYGLNEVMSLRPVTFASKSEVDGDNRFGGFIAEEVDALGLKEFVSYDQENAPDGLQYANMVALLTKAIQELKAELDATKAEVQALKGVA